VSTISPLLLQGRVAFASFVPGGVVIDAFTSPRQSPDVDGTVTLHAALPYTSWAVAAAALIDSWAEADTTVEMRFTYSKPNPQVRISDGRSMILLDLRTSPTMRLGPNQDSRPISA
jgi:hypothetical protein